MFRPIVKALTEKTIYILIAFFHFINSSSASHLGVCRNVCKHWQDKKESQTLSRAVKGLWGPQPTSRQHWNCFSVRSPFQTCVTHSAEHSLRPEVELSMRECSNCWEDFSYCEQEIDALELSLGLNVLPFGATHSMHHLPFHRTGHTSEGSAGSSDSSSGQHAKHPSLFCLSSEGTVSICLTIMGAKQPLVLSAMFL